MTWLATHRHDGGLFRYHAGSWHEGIAWLRTWGWHGKAAPECDVMTEDGSFGLTAKPME